MNTPPNDGGPAFPSQELAFQGMTLRDWFAGMTLSGMFANETIHEGLQAMTKKTGESVAKIRADYCYEIADAMLAKRAAKREMS